jgi:hypothetical protein
LEVAELKKEIELLKLRPIVQADAAVLQKRLDEAMQNCDDLYMDKLSLETLLSGQGKAEQYDSQTGTRMLTHNYGSITAYQKLMDTNKLFREELDDQTQRLTETRRERDDAQLTRKLIKCS